MLPSLAETPRYDGTAPEPREGLSSGHIPHSLPCPFPNYLEPASDSKPYTSYKPHDQLKEVLVNAVGGKDAWSTLQRGEKSVVFSCGSGMTAAVGWLANEVVREQEGQSPKSAIYDEVSTVVASAETVAVLESY
jgi:thiosulfate/3-mercaptopyruvate sulfurtransferase